MNPENIRLASQIASIMRAQALPGTIFVIAIALEFSPPKKVTQYHFYSIQFNKREIIAPNMEFIIYPEEKEQTQKQHH